MILQSLHAYYERRQRLPDPADRLPQIGLEEKEIPFILELAADGRLVSITDTRQVVGTRKVAKGYQVPQGVKRTAGVAANLLWDTAEYVLGIDIKGKSARVAEQAAAFRERIDQLLKVVPGDAGLIAVQQFLRAGPLLAAQAQANWQEIENGKNPILSFRLVTDIDLVCQRPNVVAGLPTEDGESTPEQSLFCLVTGRGTPPASLHTAIKGVWGAQTSGANVVSFNLDAFCSFGKKQGANAPVSPAAVFAYTTALNTLLAKGSRQRIQVGDASTVFWAHSEEDAAFEDEFAALFASGVDDPDAHAEQVRTVYESLRNGRFDGATGDRQFYVLGIAPNAARLSIRFWQSEKLRHIADRVGRWFDDLRITRGQNDPEYPTLLRLLAAVALLGKRENLPPNLGGDVMRAILSGGPYPAAWLNAAVIRCRAERSVTYMRAAVIKACLLRSYSLSFDEEPTVMLDINNLNVAYRLGRLFATLEKIQEESSPGLNTTIRERYFGAASSTPVAVFTTLLRLKNHHLAKLTNRGRATNFERLMGEILGEVSDFPSHLNLPDQGRFALGYYQQRQAFFTRSEIESPATVIEQ